MATTAQVTQATENYLKALTIQEQAEQALAETKEMLILVFQSAGVNEAQANEIVVKVSASTRRNFDIEKLREKLTPALFRKVTKPTVDTRAFDSAVDKGEIAKKIITTCIEVTNFFRVTVKSAKGSEKPVMNSAKEIA